MSQDKKPVTLLQEEITQWKSNVELVRSETSTFQKQLSETRQLEVSDQLLHDLHAVDHELAEKAAGGEDSDQIFTKENVGLKTVLKHITNSFLN